MGNHWTNMIAAFAFGGAAIATTAAYAEPKELSFATYTPPARRSSSTIWCRGRNG